MKEAENMSKTPAGAPGVLEILFSFVGLLSRNSSQSVGYGVTLGLYRDNGKENENYYNGVKQRLRIRV